MSRPLLSAARDRFSFPTGRSGFRQKAALILFPEAMRHLPAGRPFGGASSWERWRLAGEFRFSAPNWPAGRRRSQEIHGEDGR